MVLTVVQRDWRVYNDDTPDSSMVALAAEDTAPELAPRYINNGFVRIRVRIAETGGTAGTNLACTLQYSRDNATWQSLPAQGTSTGEHFLYADAMATAGGTVSALLLTGSATAGKYFENSSTTQSIAANETGLELDFAVQLHWPTTGTWFFRVLYNGADVPLDSGFTRPQVTITGTNRTHFVASVGGKPTAEGLTEETRMGDQKRCWFDGQRYWYFYTVNGDTTSIYYKSWTGSGEWSAAASITGISDATDQGRWRMWCREISGVHTVFLLLGNNQGTGVTRYLRRGTISGTTITWDSEQTITGDFGDEGNAIGVDDGNFVWIGGVANGGGSVWAKRSTNANDITAFQAAKTLTDAGADETRPFYIVGLASDKALCIWYDSTDTDIHAAVVTDAGGFGAFSVVNSSAVAHDQDFGFTVDKANGFVYVAHTNSVTNGAGDVLLRCFTIGSETWATCTTPPSGAGNRPFGGDDHLAVQLLSQGRIACYFTVLSNGEDRQVGYLLYSGGGTGGTWETNATHISPPRLSNLDRITTVGPGATPDRLLAFVASGDEPNVSSTVDIEWWDELLIDPKPFYMRAGAIQSSTTTATVPWPAHQIDDIALLICESANEAVSLGTPAGFVEVADSPQGTGTAAGTAATRLTVFWCRATSAAMSSPITNDPGNHVIAQILTFRRCVKSGNPWDVTAGGVQASATRTIAVPGDSTTVPKCLAVLIASNVIDLSAGQTNSWNNADLTDFHFAVHGGGTAGNGGGFGVACGGRASAGAFGTTDGRLITASEQAYLTVALRPTPPAFPIAAARRPSITEVTDDPPTLRGVQAFLFGAAPPPPPTFPLPILAQRPRPEEPLEDLPQSRALPPALLPAPLTPIPFPFEVLRQHRAPDVVLDDPRVSGPFVLFGAPPVVPPLFPFESLRQPTVAPIEPDAPQRQPDISFLFAAPPSAPPFRVELLQGRRAVEPLLDDPRLPRDVAFLFPPPATPPAFNIATLDKPRIVEQLPAEIPKQQRLTDWYKFPPAQSLAVVSDGNWSSDVLYEAGDELRVTIAGPACTNPQVRIGLGFRRVQ